MRQIASYIWDRLAATQTIVELTPDHLVVVELDVDMTSMEEGGRLNGKF